MTRLAHGSVGSGSGSSVIIPSLASSRMDAGLRADIELQLFIGQAPLVPHGMIRRKGTPMGCQSLPTTPISNSWLRAFTGEAACQSVN